MKTPSLRKHKARLAAVNDQLCYHFFASEQARPAIDRFVASNPEDLVGASFPANPFGPRIDIRNKRLPDFQKKATSTLGGLALVSAVECLISYSDDIQSFRCLLTPSPADNLNHEKAEEQFSLKLTSWGSPPLASLTNSFAYLRLRRNHIAHVNDEPHPSLKSIIKNSGSSLSKFWSQQPTSLPGLFFTSHDFIVTSEQQAFSLLNLCRVVMEKYDALLCSTLSQPHLEAYALEKFIASNKRLRGRSLADRHRKFCVYLRENYDVQLAMNANTFDTAWANA